MAAPVTSKIRLLPSGHLRTIQKPLSSRYSHGWTEPTVHATDKYQETSLTDSMGRRTERHADPKPKLSQVEVEDFAGCGSLEQERRTGMGKRGHSEEEILRVLREAESGDTVVELCRKHGIS